VFFMNSKPGLILMCGHSSIGTVRAVLEFGMVDVVEPLTIVVLGSHLSRCASASITLSPHCPFTWLQD